MQIRSLSLEGSQNHRSSQLSKTLHQPFGGLKTWPETVDKGQMSAS